MLRRALTVCSLTASVFLVACEAEKGSSGEASGSLIPSGKSDDYFSPAGREYTITGKTTGQFELNCVKAHPDSPDATKRCILEAITVKNFEIAWFLNRYLMDKHGDDAGWGGFTAMTRPASYDALEVGEPDEEGVFTYTFTSEISGPFDLLGKLPTVACEKERCFSLEIPVLPNELLRSVATGEEWYREPRFSNYDPETYAGAKEVVELRAKPYPRSNDAYLEYDKLLAPEQLARAGGALKVGVYVGWDYNEERYDLRTARELYRWLTNEGGFKSPVASYDDLKIDSGDFTKTINVKGVDIPVAVSLVHPGQGDPADPKFAGQMKAAMIRGFAERQVILFDGHAGPLYGFALGNWQRTDAGELDDSELPALQIPENFYQVVLASGCDTYMVADSLYLNPVKGGRVDMDVITSSSFSSASLAGLGAKQLIEAVANEAAAGGQLEPRTYGELLRELNRDRAFTPIFGVHGIDDNPRANPLADDAALCEPCNVDDQCGGFDSKCVDYGATGKFCGTECQIDNDCPDGYSCFAVLEGDAISGRVCGATSLSCSDSDDAPVEVWINELHYDDGPVDSGEGVEIAGRADTDLTGYALVFYDGAPDQLRVYDTIALDGVIPKQSGEAGTLWFAAHELQDGGDSSSPSPDGVALVNARDEVVMFLSYEGAFTPTNGPAAGVESVDIGVAEPSGLGGGTSLAVVGSGSRGADFRWKTGVFASPGQPNPGQSLQ